MSDEYGSSGGGFGGSLVNDSLDSADTQPSNNPPNDSSDTTSSGGYGGSGDSFSDERQRGSDASSRGQLGQGMAGEQFSGEGKGGAPKTAADANAQGEGTGLSDSLSPYGDSAEEKPAESKAFERRQDQFESGPGAAGEQDVGA